MTYRAANYDRIVYEHLVDGIYVVGDEGWLKHEWMHARHICVICSRAFVNLTADGRAVGGGKQRYCSAVCGKEGKRRGARSWQSRRAVA